MHQQSRQTDEGRAIDQPASSSIDPASNTGPTTELDVWYERIEIVSTTLNSLQEGRHGWGGQLMILEQAGISTESLGEQIDSLLGTEAEIRSLIRNSLEVLGQFHRLSPDALEAVGVDSHVSQMVYNLQRHTHKLSEEQRELETLLTQI